MDESLIFGGASFSVISVDWQLTEGGGVRVMIEGYRLDDVGAGEG